MALQHAFVRQYSMLKGIDYRLKQDGLKQARNRAGLRLAFQG